MKKLKVQWSEIKASFWFVPVLIILLFFVIAIVSLLVDTQVTFSQKGLFRFMFISSADSARSILSTIAGTMVGVAGTVFSITLVALTLASSQFGSRLIRNFMYDRLNQIVLGSYIATYMYCLIIMNAIKYHDGIIFIPSFSILMAFAAALLNVILLILFFHHTAVSIQANYVIDKVSSYQYRNIDDLFPDEIGTIVETPPAECRPFSRPSYSLVQSIPARRSGYLQYVYYDTLLSIASSLHAVIEIYYRPGAYMVNTIEIGVIHSDNPIEEDVLRRIQNQFVVGRIRTQEQDVEHFIHQMVEIAERALSPGINDPYTAITCIDNLSSMMAYLSTRKFPSKNVCDEEGNIRLVLNVITYERVLDASFNQIRQFAKGNPPVTIRLMEALINIDKCTKSPVHKKAIIKHAKMLVNMAKKTFDEPLDLEDLLERSEQLGVDLQ